MFRTTCDCCLKKKIKCDGQKPFCGHCEKYGLSATCRYGRKRRPGRKRTKNDISGQNQQVGQYDRESVLLVPEEEKMIIKRPKSLMAQISLLGQQESAFLDIYLKLFEDHFPSVISAHHCAALSKLMNKPWQESMALGSPNRFVDMAQIASLWSGIAVGSILMGNRRDVGGYIQRAAQAIEGCGHHTIHGPGSGAIAVAHLHLALMYDWLDQQGKCRFHLAQAEAQKVVDPEVSASVKSLKLFSGLSKSNAVDCIFEMIGRWEDNVFTKEELKHFPLNMQIYYESVVFMCKAGFFFEGTEEEACQLYQDIYQNELLAEKSLNEQTRVSTINYGLLQMQLAGHEIAYLGLFETGIKRIRQIVDVLCNDHISTLLIGPFWVWFDVFAYVLWLVGDVTTYNKVMLSHNALLKHKPEESPLLPFEKMNWEGYCTHFFCQNFMPKFLAAVRMYALQCVSPKSQQNAVISSFATHSTPAKPAVSTARSLWSQGNNSPTDVKSDTVSSDLCSNCSTPPSVPACAQEEIQSADSSSPESLPNIAAHSLTPSSSSQGITMSDHRAAVAAESMAFSMTQSMGMATSYTTEPGIPTEGAFLKPTQEPKYELPECVETMFAEIKNIYGDFMAGNNDDGWMGNESFGSGEMKG